jgi:hypothetical protein
MKRTWILALCALAGVMAGLALPKPVGATAIHAELRVYGGATSYLSCGWHSNCTTGSETSGDALDWDNDDNATVYWESKGYRDDGTTAAIASGTSRRGPDTGCKTIIVDVSDGFGFAKGEADYLHTAAWVVGGPTYFDGSGSWASAEWAIGFSVTVANETSGCSIDGSHLHQVNGSTYWTRQGVSSDYYPNYVNGGTKSGYRDLANWQFKQSFCWYC